MRWNVGYFRLPAYIWASLTWPMRFKLASRDQNDLCITKEWRLTYKICRLAQPNKKREPEGGSLSFTSFRKHITGRRWTLCASWKILVYWLFLSSWNKWKRGVARLTIPTRAAVHFNRGSASSEIFFRVKWYRHTKYLKLYPRSFVYRVSSKLGAGVPLQFILNWW